MSENDVNNCGESSEGDSTEEEIEPKLKYVRMSNDLQDILQTEIASCIAIHPKFVCLGTSWGMVYVFDHQGNRIRNNGLKAHTVAVNMISIDARGECVASCSDDGNVHVCGLYSGCGDEPAAEAFTLSVGRHVHAVALDPAVQGWRRARLVTGDERLTLHERSVTVLGLGRVRSTALCDSEGAVGALAWAGQFIAWASTIGVRLYDIKQRRSLGLIQWERPLATAAATSVPPSLTQYRCCLRWADKKTLMIGWADTVRICLIRKRGTAGGRGTATLDDDSPEYQVDPISTFRTDFAISGIAPLEQQLVLLGVAKQPLSTPAGEDVGCGRPQLHVVEYRDCEYAEVCTDSLSLRGYAQYTCTDYHLEVLADENRFFVVAPKDVVVASPCDLDDRVHWLVQHSRYEQAMEVIEKQPQQQHSPNDNANGKHTVLSVGIAYLDHLLEANEYERAGRLCLRLFGRDPDLWHAHVYKFARVRQLRAISAYLPRTLGPHIYEMVLYEYLKSNAAGFLGLVREWAQPGLYNTVAVVNAVLEHLLVCDVDTEKSALMEALAVLYGHERRYDKALSMYLKLKHPAVFDMIKENDLYGAVHPMIVDLMKLDEVRTVDLLLHDRRRIPPDVVVATLRGCHDGHLYRYLDALERVDARESAPHHGLMVQLYAVFARDKLLPFLKRSDQYPIQDALDVCQRANYYPETVYLLGRIGDTREALALIISRLHDVRYALAFCQEHDDADLWADLIEHSAQQPAFVTYLLPRVAGHVDPRVLVNRIRPGAELPGLRDALVRMLRQCNLQASIQEGCQKILVADYFALHERLVRARQRGLHVGDDLMCGACHRQLLAASAVVDATHAAAHAPHLIAYNCRHMFHERCLPQPIGRACAICSPSHHDDISAD